MARARWLANGMRWSSRSRARRCRIGVARRPAAGRERPATTRSTPIKVAVSRGAAAAAGRVAPEGAPAGALGLLRTEWSIEREIETIVARDRLLVAGPWLSEVGFETLYWVPFLHWLKTAFHLDPEPPRRRVARRRRLAGTRAWPTATSRSGTRSIPRSSRGATPRAASPSSTSPSRARSRDPAIASPGGSARSDFDVLHPGLMYRLFTLYWSGQRAMGFVDAHRASRR